jgi:hypothetical protein
LDVAKSGAKVLDQAGKVYKILSEHDAREARLRALRDCAENPTAPTARDAQRTDPNYRRATSDVIDSAQANLKMNTLIRLGAVTLNSAASVALGSTRGKAVSILAKVEDKLLTHVADEYIMKDAGKGVVTCEPDCGPLYVPEMPPEQLASYPPEELTCSQTTPEQLTCAAGGAPNSTPGPSWVPSLPNPPPPAPMCVTLTSAEFAFRYEHEASACGPGSCGTSSDARGFTAIVPLRFDDGAYEGDGTGVYRESYSQDVTARVCSQRTTTTTEGSPDIKVYVLPSIDNDIVGGIDTGALPPETSVVEILVEGPAFHIADSVGTCFTPNAQSNPTTVGFDCHFYGVELYRAGSYRAFKDGSPGAGVCTLTLR